MTSRSEMDHLIEQHIAAELEHVQHAERDGAVAARCAREPVREAAARVVLDHAEVVAVERPHRRHLLVDERGHQLFVEVLRGRRTRHRTGGPADHVVLDVVGVHGHRPGRVAGHLSGDVLLDQTVHLRTRRHCHLQISTVHSTKKVRSGVLHCQAS